MVGPPHGEGHFGLFSPWSNMVRSCVEGCMVSENQTKSRFIESRLDLTSSLMEKESGEHVGPLSLPTTRLFYSH